MASTTTNKPANKTVSGINGKAKKKRAIIPTGKYINASKPNRYTKQEQNNIADEFLKWYKSSEDNLFFTRFFADKLISYKMIHNWKNSNEYFAYIYDLAIQIREQRLQERLISTTQPTGIIFLLKNLHGYRNEPKERDESPQPVEIIMRPQRLADSDFNDNEDGKGTRLTEPLNYPKNTEEKQ